MANLRCAAWAPAGTATASLADSRVDFTNAGKIIEFDGTVRTETDAELTADTDVWIDP